MENYYFCKKITKNDEIGECTSKVMKEISSYDIDEDDLEKIKKTVYEAEKNIMLYAKSGEISIEIANDCFKAKFKDEGPGIDNVGKAFGLGKGLSVIQDNVDYLDIASIPGVGTEMDIAISLM